MRARRPGRSGRGCACFTTSLRVRGAAVPFHRGRSRFIGMPNIILDRKAFPELIQQQASPAGIAAAALPFLTDPAVRERAEADLRLVRAALGEPGAVRRTADLILDLAARRQPWAS